MTTNNDTEKLAKAQVEAFMSLLEQRLEIDESKLKMIASIQSRNGKNYVTWAWVIAVLLGLLGFLVVKQIDRIDQIELRQTDVRERLRVLEAHVYRPSMP